eukprot:EG_transcript_3352
MEYFDPFCWLQYVAAQGSNKPSAPSHYDLELLILAVSFSEHPLQANGAAEDASTSQGMSREGMALLRRTQYCCVVAADGQTLETWKFPLTPAFEVSLRSAVRLSFPARPGGVVLRLVESVPWQPRQCVADVAVPLEEGVHMVPFCPDESPGGMAAQPVPDGPGDLPPRWAGQIRVAVRWSPAVPPEPGSDDSSVADGGKAPEGEAPWEDVKAAVLGGQLDPFDPLNKQVMEQAALGHQKGRRKQLQDDVPPDVDQRGETILPYEYSNHLFSPEQNESGGDQRASRQKVRIPLSVLHDGDVDQVIVAKSNSIRHRLVPHVRLLPTVVTQPPPEPAGTLLPALRAFFAPLAGLRPARYARQVDAAGLGEVRLHIAQGLGLPRRAPPSGTASPVLQPYVEVSFQGSTTCTPVSAGESPAFRHTLHLPVAASRWTFEDLQWLSDDLELHVYDRVPCSSTAVAAEPQQRGFERRLLGSVRLPFRTLCCASPAGGRCPLEMPAVLLGYDVRQPAILCFTASLQPPPPPPPPHAGELQAEAGEPLAVHRFARRWEADLRARLRGGSGSHEATGRTVHALATTLQGTSVLVCRYLTALAPPLGMADAAHVARFVSAIPARVDRPPLPLPPEPQWLTPAEVLAAGSASPAERAVLLASLFLHLRCFARLFVALGHSMLDLEAAAVVTQDSTEGWRLWDPLTGRRWGLSRPELLPLSDVGTLFDPHNVWVNPLPRGAPLTGSFFAAAALHWERLFCDPVGLAGLPLAAPVFVEADAAAAARIEADVREMVRLNVAGWRPCPTQWCIALGRALDGW